MKVERKMSTSDNTIHIYIYYIYTGIYICIYMLLEKCGSTFANTEALFSARPS